MCPYNTTYLRGTYTLYVYLPICTGVLLFNFSLDYCTTTVCLQLQILLFSSVISQFLILFSGILQQGLQFTDFIIPFASNFKEVFSIFIHFTLVQSNSLLFATFTIMFLYPLSPAAYIYDVLRALKSYLYNL